MKPAHNLPAPFRRKKALDIGNQEYKYTQERRNLYRVVDKELNAGYNFCAGFKPK